MDAMGPAEVACVGSPADVEDPRPAGGWVADPSGALWEDGDGVAYQHLLLREIEDIEVVMLLVPCASRPLPELADAVAAAWGLGSAVDPAGLLWVVDLQTGQAAAVSNAALRAQVPDEDVLRVTRDAMGPWLAAGNPPRGLIAGLEALREEASPWGRWEPPSEVYPARSKWGLTATLAGGGLAATALLAGLAAWRRRQMGASFARLTAGETVVLPEDGSWRAWAAALAAAWRDSRSAEAPTRRGERRRPD